MELQYVYLIQEREFIQLDKPIFKIGKTKQPNFTRFTQYPKDSALIFQSACYDCDICEKEIIQIFKKKYQQKKNIGTEYFEGDYTCMLSDICDITSQLWKKQKAIDQEKKIIEEQIKQAEYELREEIEEEIEDDLRQKSENIKRKLEAEIIEGIENPLIQKVENKFGCLRCKFSSSSKYCLDRHFATKKHIQSPDAAITNFKCKKCDKYFKFASGLSVHKKKCKNCERTKRYKV
jgi:hypothetical protein